MSRVKISVIIAARDHARFLGRCLRSLFSQVGSSPYEIVVVDDNSGDETPMILEAFSSEIVVHRNNENLGLPTSLNLAIEASRGEYIVRVDSDDYVSKHYLAVLELALDMRPDLGAVESDYVIFEDDASENGNFESALKSPIGCGIMFRKSLMVEAGLYNPEFLAHEDKEFRARFEKFGRIGHVAIPLYRYRRHASNMTNNETLLREFSQKLREQSGRD